MATAQGCCACVKYFLFLFNVLFVLIGLGSLGLGIYSLAHNNGDVAVVIDNTEGTFGGVLIAVGVLICVLAAAGCCGAVTEHRASLLFYAIALGFIFILEAVAGGVGYHYRSQLQSVVNTGMEKTLVMYRPDNHEGSVERSWDSVQKTLGCCGVDSPDNWLASKTQWSQAGSIGYPLTCCSHYDKNHDTVSPCLNTTLLGFRNSGCLSRVEKSLKERWGVWAGAAIAIPVLQLIGIASACGLRRHLARSQDYFLV